MTSLELYDSSGSVMEAVLSRLAAHSPDSLINIPNVRCLHLCGDRLSSEGRDSRIVFQGIVLDSFSQLRVSLPGRLQMNWRKCEDGFVITCNTSNHPLHSYYRPMTRVSPCFDVIHAHCIGQTDTTSGFDLVTLSKCHWNVTSDQNLMKISVIHIEHFTYDVYEN